MRIRAIAFLLALVIASAGAAALARPTSAQPPPPYTLYIPQTASDYCGDYYDDFDDPLSGWFTGDRATLSAGYADGEYRILITDTGYVWLVGAPGCARQDYDAAVDARWAGTPGNFYALLFGMEAGFARYYMLAVNTDARVFLVFRNTGSSLQTLIDETRSNAIRPGGEWNRLAAARRGDVIVLSINETPVAELTVPVPGSPVYAGVAAATYMGVPVADARFDNFVYNSPPNTLPGVPRVGPSAPAALPAALLRQSPAVP